MPSTCQHLFPESPISMVGKKCWGTSPSLSSPPCVMTDRSWCINTPAPRPLGLLAQGGSCLSPAFIGCFPFPVLLSPFQCSYSVHLPNICLLINHCLRVTSGGSQARKCSDSALSVLEFSLTKYSHMCSESLRVICKEVHRR